jgi:hypothetical protein
LLKIGSVSDIPGADRIQSANVLGNTVVVSKQNNVGELGLYFECDGKLSLEFLKANDLIAYKDEFGNKKGGFFDESGRVRAQKFKGVKSDGFWCPLSFLDFAGVDLTFLKEHDTLDCLNGIPICEKYITKATQKAANANGNKQQKKKEVKQKIPVFPKAF